MLLGSSPDWRGLGRLKKRPQAALAEEEWRIIGRIDGGGGGGGGEEVYG